MWTCPRASPAPARRIFFVDRGLMRERGPRASAQVATTWCIRPSSAPSSTRWSPASTRGPQESPSLLLLVLRPLLFMNWKRKLSEQWSRTRCWACYRRSLGPGGLDSNVGPGRSAGPKPTTEGPGHDRGTNWACLRRRCFFFARSFFFRALAFARTTAASCAWNFDESAPAARPWTASSSPSSLAPKPQTRRRRLDGGVVTTLAALWPLLEPLVRDGQRAGVARRLEELPELSEEPGLVEQDHCYGMIACARRRLARVRPAAPVRGVSR